jgi:oligopeptide transport system ATP-binding protein
LAPLLATKDLARYFPVRSALPFRPRAWIKAVDGVDCVLERDESLAIVGESGCGKSTLARLICALLPPSRGQVLFDGLDLGAMSGERLRRLRPRFQIVFQNPYGALNPRKTVRQHLDEPLRIHGRGSSAERAERVTQVMQDVGLSLDLLDRLPRQLSGGQRQRVSIARALALEPELLVCDEIVSALDVSVKAEILNLLADLRRRYRLSILFITHDLGIVPLVCDRVAVMYLGRIVELGSAAEVLASPRHPYTEGLLAALPRPDPEAPAEWLRLTLEGEPPSPINPPSGCRFRTRCPLAQPLCAESEPPLVEVGGGRAVACHFRS